METEHIFLPAFHPLDRPPQFQRQVGDGDFLGEKAALFAEPAANVGAGHPHRLRRTPQQPRQVVADFVGMLRGIPYRQQIGGGVIGGQQAARLHRRRGQALHLEPMADDAIGGGKGIVQIAPGVDGAQHDVAAQVVVNHRGVIGGGLPRVNDRGQDFVVHRHQFGGVVRGVDVLGQRDRHRLPGVANLVPGQRRVAGRAQFVGVGRFAGGQMRQPGEVGGGDDRRRPRQGRRRGGVDPPDAGVAVGTADDHRVKHPRQRQIVYVR